MNITAFRKNGKFFSLLMAGVIILFVCTQILVSDSLKVRETISDNHMQINNFTDLFQTVTALRKSSNEFEEDTLIITTKIQKSSLHISLAALLEMIAANLFSYTGVMLLLFNSDRIRRFVPVHFIHLSDGKKSLWNILIQERSVT